MSGVLPVKSDQGVVKGAVSKPWDPTSLAVGGAMLAPRGPAPSLTGPVHPLFARKRWEVSDEDYQLLMPSMRLATRLLEVGMPYLASFLPSSIIFGSPQEVSHAEHSHLVCPRVIPLKHTVLIKDLQAAELELEAIARCIKWRLNDRMHATRNWNGITRIVDYGEADFHELDENEIRESDLQAAQAGRVRRPLVIAIMDLLLVPMRTHPADSEIRLKAQFMAAITMIHEIGHAIFLQDYRSFNPPSGDEPYVEKDVDSELGRSFVSWIFNGFHPQFCESHDQDAKFGSLGWSLYWQPLFKTNQLFGNDKEHKRPLYEKLYAIPVSYLSNTFRQTWWEANQRGVPLHQLAATLKKSLSLDYSDKAEAAISVKANWWMDPIAKLPRWKGHYRITRFSSGQPVQGLVKDQIVAQMKLEKQTFTFTIHDEIDRDYDAELERLLREQTPCSWEDKVIAGNNNRTVIAYSIETHDDGMLDEDIGYIQDDDSEIVTQIEVRYRPTTDFQPRSTKLVPPKKLVEEARKEVWAEIAAEEKAAASEMFASGPRVKKRGSLNSSLSGPSKRLRTFLEADKLDENSTLAEKVLKALSQASANEIGHWTRIQAWYYCLQHGLSLLQLPKTAAAQQAKLDNGTEIGNKIMRKIQYHLVEKLWGEIHDNGLNPESVLVAKYILGLIDFFVDEDIDSLAVRMKMPVPNTPSQRKDIRAECKGYFERVIKGEELREPSPQVGLTLEQQLAPLHKLAPEPSQWSEDDLRSWCRHKSIPQWGSISGLITRVNRFREEEKNVKVGIAGRIKTPPGRTDRTGTEIYRFSAVLRHSSLDALKSSLFIAGNFPSDTELDLWVNSDHILQPGPLTEQISTVDWKRLVLRAWRTATPKEPIKISREERIEKINRHNELIDTKLRSEQRKSTKELTNEEVVIEYPHPGSVLNKVTDISQRALALTRIRNAPGTIPGQSYKKHDRAHLIKGRHLNDMMMDLEDLETKVKEGREKKTGIDDMEQRESRHWKELSEREARRITNMKLVEKRFTKQWGAGGRLGVGEEEVPEEVKGKKGKQVEEDDWHEDYV
ncbi:hypothetical protein BTUL_0063g00360 [Botrytis tulipae]|uniref:Uncharacterized protein n=1 Tax=Botrytis tulipae TaxID=87230 RepID=A0A4Z1EN52_9HELO|nr:hypothetical protein BTUL_0063g00360 [Botrytis tulipae]